MPKMKTHKGAKKRFSVTAYREGAPPEGEQEPHPHQEGRRSGSATCAARRS